MKIRKLLAVSLVACSMMLSSFAVHAEDTIYDSSAYNSYVTLNCTIADTYQIAMPTEVLFSYDSSTGDYVGTYTIKCKSCLLDGESVIIKPISYAPELRNTSSHRIEAVITQAIDTWTNNPTAPNEIQSSSSDWVETTGTITVPRASYKGKPAGVYGNSIEFRFTKTDIE